MIDYYKLPFNISISSNDFSVFEPVTTNLDNLIDIMHSSLYYSAGTFKDNKRGASNWITNSQRVIILDFDEGFTDREFQIFDQYIGVICPTRSHMKDKHGLIAPRYRVVLMLDKPLSVNSIMYKNIHKNMYKQLNVPADESCADAARFYFGNPDNKHIARRLKGNKLFSWEEFNYTDLQCVSFNKADYKPIDVSKYSYIDIGGLLHLNPSSRYQCPICAVEGIDPRKHHLGFEKGKQIVSCFFDDEHSRILRKLYYNYINGISPEMEKTEMGKPRCTEQDIPVIVRNPKPTNYNQHYIDGMSYALDSLEKSNAIFLDIETFSPMAVVGTEDEAATNLKHLGYVKAAYRKVANSFNDVALDYYKNKIRLITLGNGNGEGKVTIPFDMAIVSKEQEERIINVIHSKYIIGQNLKFDFSTLSAKYGFKVLPTYCFDTMLADQLLYNATNFDKIHIGSGLGALSIKHTGKVMQKELGASDWGNDNLTTDQLSYALDDVYKLYEIYPVLWEKLSKEYTYFDHKNYDINQLDFLGPISKSLHPIVAMEMQFLLECIRIEMRGIQPNVEFLDKCVRNYTNAVINIERNLGINPKSSKQCVEFLQTHVDPNITSSNAETLKAYEGNPFTDSIRKAKALSTRKGLMSAMMAVFPHDNRLHPSFKQVLVTGRMSCKNPNMQQIPRTIKCFVYTAPKGRVVFDADYPAIELRLMCVKSMDRNMLEAYASNTDLHYLTASKVFRKPIDTITKDERTQAKAVNFGFIYGMMAETFQVVAKTSYGVEYTVEQARNLREGFMSAYPDIRNLVDNTFDEFKQGTPKPRIAYFKDGSSREIKDTFFKKVHTLLGRVSCADTPNKSLNYPIQGSGGDMTKLAVILTGMKYRQLGLDAFIINLIHDDIVVESSIEVEEQAKEIFTDCMDWAANYILQYRFKTSVKEECDTLSKDGVLLKEISDDLFEKEEDDILKDNSIEIEE
jgi:DNA polymerase-1